MKAVVEINTDMDFHLFTPVGHFTEFMKHTISAPTEDELRQEIVMFLARIEVRMPWEQEYCAFERDKKDTYFKYVLYEAMHQIASHKEINFSRGGNNTLTILVDIEDNHRR